MFPHNEKFGIRPHICPVCFAPKICPGNGWLTTGKVGLPHNWQPPMHREWEKGPLVLDEYKLARELPGGISWVLFGTHGAHRVEAHGGQTWQLERGLYLALYRR